MLRDVNRYLALYLYDLRIGKHLVQNLELVAPWLEGVDNPVLFARADLHQGKKARIRSVVVMLGIYGDFRSSPEFFKHL